MPVIFPFVFYSARKHKLNLKLELEHKTTKNLYSNVSGVKVFSKKSCGLR